MEPKPESPAPRLLLLMTTTTYRAGAFLDAARRLGVEVVVGTDRPQATVGLNPLGHLTLDFDAPAKAVEAIVARAAGHPFAAVIATEDDGVLVAARAAEALGIRHAAPGAVAACRDKLETRRTLHAAGFGTPWFEDFDPDADPFEVAAAVSYPCVVKPTSLSRSRGVIRADDPERMVEAFRRVAAILARPDVRRAGERARILVEEYLPGEEVALEGLLSGGRLRTLALFDKPDPLVGPTFEETIYVTPSRHPAPVRERVEAVTRRVVEALGLAEGPVHAELRIDRDQPTLVEIAPRSIGGLCSRTLRFGDGRVSLEELILRNALGMDAALEREAAAAGVMMIPVPGPGVLQSTDGLDEARAVAGIEDIRITIAVGQELVPLPEGSRYLGFIFARGGDPAAVEEALREAHRRIAITVLPHAATAAGG